MKVAEVMTFVRTFGHVYDGLFVSPKKQKLVAAMPIENILLETDSPALGPVKQVKHTHTFLQSTFAI